MTSNYDDNGKGTDANRRFSRYDFVLAVIPTAFLIAIVVGQLVSIPTHTTVTAATAIGTLALVDGLFVNPPRSGSGTA